MDHDTLRQISDSWGLLYLVLIFIGIIAFTFRPGSRERAERLARLPLDEDENNVR